MVYKNFFFILLFTLLANATGNAQQRTVDEVQKSIGDFSASIKTYQNALVKIKPALQHDATKNLAETWWIAGKAGYGLYSKFRIAKSMGNSIDDKQMGQALIAGYEYCIKALELDSVKVLNRDGSPKINKKTGQAKVKTKYSKEIQNRILKYLVDYSTMGAELYKAEDWAGAFKAWNIYHEVATSPMAQKRHVSDPDSIIGLMSYYQGMAAMKMNQLSEVHRLLKVARQYGYKKKTVYDNDLFALTALGDTVMAVTIAQEAFRLYGKEDIRYLRIMINDCINKHNYRDAEVMLDQAMLNDSLNAEYLNLKGNIVELQSSVLEARPYYQQAVELDSTLAQAQFDMGRCYYLEALQYAQSHSKKSQKALTKAIAPVLRRAVEHLEKSFELNPQNADAKNILRDIYYKLGDAKKLDKLDLMQ